MTDQSRRRFLAGAALTPGLIALGPTRAMERVERPTLTRLGQRLRRREIEPGEALVAIEEGGLACLDLDVDGFGLLDGSARRSIEKWLHRRARLGLSEARRVLWTREWSLVEFWTAPASTATRFVDHGPPGAVIAMIDRGTGGIRWPEDEGDGGDREL